MQKMDNIGYFANRMRYFKVGTFKYVTYFLGKRYAVMIINTYSNCIHSRIKK